MRMRAPLLCGDAPQRLPADPPALQPGQDLDRLLGLRLLSVADGPVGPVRPNGGRRIRPAAAAPRRPIGLPSGRLGPSYFGATRREARDVFTDRNRREEP